MTAYEASLGPEEEVYGEKLLEPRSQAYLPLAVLLVGKAG